MITTFERLAKVLKGEAPAANWIEKAFADLVSAIGAVLPSVSNSDRGKFLGVNTSNNNLGWKTIRQVPDVENADKGKYLHANNSTGALEWSEAGGGNIEVVTFTPGAGGSISADKTFIEIAQMVTDGKTVLGRINGINGTGYMQSANSESFEFVFLTANTGANPELFVSYIVYTSEQISSGAFSVEGSN